MLSHIKSGYNSHIAFVYVFSISEQYDNTIFRIHASSYVKICTSNLNNMFLDN